MNSTIGFKLTYALESIHTKLKRVTPSTPRGFTSKRDQSATSPREERRRACERSGQEPNEI